jgi:hypothetical protein
VEIKYTIDAAPSPIESPAPNVIPGPISIGMIIVHYKITVVIVFLPGSKLVSRDLAKTA